jgi:hypothetical protein
MPGIHVIADGLAHEVVTDCEKLKAVAGEETTSLVAIVGFRERTMNFEVVSPTRELEAIKAPFLRLSCDCLEREIGPLASE